MDMKRASAPDLFDHASQETLQRSQPLAARMRPRTLDEYVGQEEIAGPGRLLRRVGSDVAFHQQQAGLPPHAVPPRDRIARRGEKTNGVFQPAGQLADDLGIRGVLYRKPHDRCGQVRVLWIQRNEATSYFGD